VTRTGSTRKAGSGFDTSRLRIAESYLEAAKVVYEFSDGGAPGNPIVSLAVMAAIGFTDALTARFGGEFSASEHSAAIAVLKKALGNRLPRAQENALAKVLSTKDQAQYSARIITASEAQHSLKTIQKFALWARQELEKPV
jgi:hypothetical protein